LSHSYSYGVPKHKVSGGLIEFWGGPNREASRTYFFGIYCFINHLLGIFNYINIPTHPYSGYACMHWIWSMFSRTDTKIIYTFIEGLYEIHYKMHRNLLKSQKISPGSYWLIPSYPPAGYAARLVSRGNDFSNFPQTLTFYFSTIISQISKISKNHQAIGFSCFSLYVYVRCIRCWRKNALTLWRVGVKIPILSYFTQFSNKFSRSIVI
jgi:hypothetical protein